MPEHNFLLKLDGYVELSVVALYLYIE